MLQPGQRVSEYVLESILGAGTFGQVWWARHHVWADQFVAVKIPTDPQYVRNLQREGAAIHGLTHPNIVRAIGFDPYADPPYLVMEYVPGTSLRTLIQAGPMPVAQAAAILRQVLAALAHVHGNNVLHRDVKPENILLHERAAREGYEAPGVVKLTDFGLGKAAASAVVGSIAYSASMHDPAAREIAGTLDYMAPETRQANAGVDGRADLYACGVVLYEMLTGQRPVGHELPSELNRNVPPAMDEVFRRAYARVEKRFASADQFIAALTAAAVRLLAPTPAVPAVRALATATSASPAGATWTCPTCKGNGIEPGSDWTFCDLCHGSGKLRGTDTYRGTSVEVECGKCRGRGTQPPAKCSTCKGKGRVEAQKIAVATVAAPPALPPINRPPVTLPRTSCPACRHPVGEHDQFCIHCGTQMVPVVRRCPRCAAYPDFNDRFCIFCGEPLAV